MLTIQAILIGYIEYFSQGGD